MLATDLILVIFLWEHKVLKPNFCMMFCVQKERKLLQVKRLDLDAAKTRLKKARMADARAAVSIRTHTPNPKFISEFFG